MNKNKKHTYFAERPHSQGLYDASKETKDAFSAV